VGTSFTDPIIGFVGALFDVRVASQNIWVTDDLAAVAMWDSPGTSDAAPVHAESVIADGLVSLHTVRVLVTQFLSWLRVASSSVPLS
jgi:hypothetical protein